MKHETSGENSSVTLMFPRSFFGQSLVLQGFQCLYYTWKIIYTKNLIHPLTSFKQTNFSILSSHY